MRTAVAAIVLSILLVAGCSALPAEHTSASPKPGEPNILIIVDPMFIFCYEDKASYVNGDLTFDEFLRHCIARYFG